MEKPPLLYSDLEPGRSFRNFVLDVNEEFIRKFCQAVEDEDPVHFEMDVAKDRGYEFPVAPESIAGIYGRRSYLEDYTMPPGGILVEQEFEFLYPVYTGDTITASAKVIDRYENKGKKFVEIETLAKNQDGRKVGVVRLKAMWPG